MNKNSNKYTIIYTIVMVVIVGALLATLATLLKPAQEENVLNEQKESIMKAFGAEGESFDEVVAGVIKNGNEFHKVDDVKPLFELISNRKALAELYKDYAAADDELPIFMYEREVEKKGHKYQETLYVVPIVGKGLWGDIWGYIALKRTAGNLEVVGITMDHAGETPGLGAEIATDEVQDKFVGKLVFEGALVYGSDNKIALKMQKGVSASDSEKMPSTVDAISGGTKTCDGVNSMFENSLEAYADFFANPKFVEKKK